MGIQSSAVRHLRVEGVYTTAATATTILFVEALTDWSFSHAAGLRLGGVLTSLFLGAVAGGLLLVRAPLYAPLLPFMITLVAVVMAAIFLRDCETANL
jgi:uncharacterized membrane protein YoaK (UPF0700 family)